VWLRLITRTLLDRFGQDQVMSLETTLPLGATETRKFHFGLNVADIDRAVDFYRILFGVEPAKHFSDYAKFEVDDPPLVLSLNPSPRAAGGALNHVGFRVASSEQLVAVQHRLEMAGIRTEREEGVECCYARQTKFWVPDADKNLWEIYTLEDDLDHSGFGGAEGGGVPRVDDRREPVVWEHMLYVPLPQQIPLGDGGADEVRLEGTFNADLADSARSCFIVEVFRVLRPRGRVVVHGLVSDRPFPGVPALPGPAAMVRRIPMATAALDELAACGFTGLFYERLGDIHCFQVGGVELREMRLVGVKPFEDKSSEATGANTEYFVLYRGPLAEVHEQNRVFPRGKRVRVEAATWWLFRQAPFAEQFTCFVPVACEAAAVGTTAQARA
jgi:catechol 2,3-dioxygenase-like lactoylglutathione lyase family enzyme